MAEAKRVREQRVAIRMSPAEIDMLRELAERQGLTASDIVRQCIRRQHAQVFGEPQQKKQK